MLAIEMTLLTGRYVATAYNNRRESEWPPHPARVFSAMVATHFSAGDVHERDDERAVLEWLECQGSPEIVASEAVPRDVTTVFVPVNDVALTDVDEEAQRVSDARAKLAEAEAIGGKTRAKCATDLKKVEGALTKAIAAAVGIPARPMNPRYGQRVLPEYRGRQPRTFPSVTPSDPRVTFVWAEAAPSDVQRCALQKLLRRVVRVGHSSSLVAMRLTDDPGQPTWRPDQHGESVLRVVQPGQLMALERAFEQHRELEPRVMPSLPQPYTREQTHAAVPSPASVFSDQWLVFRRIEGPVLPMTASAGVARALRRALMSFASEPIPEVLSGHVPGGGPTERPHVAVVPLPFVAHPRATGAILGIAVVLPRVMDVDARRAVFAAVDRWEQSCRQEDEDTPIVQLNLGRAGELRLERVEWGSVPATLRAETWCGPANVWLSATPVALDRNPGDLWSRDLARQAAALQEAAVSIGQACERVHLPRPVRVEILPAAPIAGAAKARHYPSYPAEPGRIRRVLTHVRVEFDQPVTGPVLLGAGRHVGLGLFRPERTGE
jgi:CRISPR-associated protein Csb2